MRHNLVPWSAEYHRVNTTFNHSRTKNNSAQEQNSHLFSVTQNMRQIRQITSQDHRFHLSHTAAGRRGHTILARQLLFNEPSHGDLPPQFKGKASMKGSHILFEAGYAIADITIK